MSGKTARQLRKQTAAERVLRYRVTQPAKEAQQAPYPLQTTRISSNSRYIHTANHPEWFQLAQDAEAGMIAYMSERRLREDFVNALATEEASTPLHAYGLTVIKQFKEFGAVNLRDHPEMAAVLNNAALTVYNNLAKVIFADPDLLAGSDYSPENFELWSTRLKAFNDSDVFTYRPPEMGYDLDGIEKPIVELCPSPQLGRHLVRVGFELLTQHILQRQNASVGK